MKKSNSRLLKFVALNVLVTFSVTTISWAAPAVEKAPAADRVTVQTLADTLQIPEALGTIQTRFSPASSASTLIHIQDAHSNLSAQNSVRKILHYLSGQYSADQIFLEGAMGELDTSLLNFFKDGNLNQKTADLLEKKALLGGTERFLLDQSQAGKKAAGTGVEDAGLYGKNLEQFRSVFLFRSYSENYLSSLRTQILTEASRVFNKNLRDFFKEWIFYQDNPEEMSRHFDALEEKAGKVLGLNLHQPEAQVQWPQLARLVRLKDLDGKIDAVKAAKEKEQLEIWLEKQGDWKTSEEAENFRDFLESVFNASKMSEPRLVAETFYHTAFPKGFSFQTYPELSKSLGKSILEAEMDGEAVFAESKKLTRTIFEKLTRGSKEKEILTRYERYGVLKKLFLLELTRTEYLELARNKEVYRPSNLYSNRAEINTAFEQACAFYETALAREEAIEKRVMEKMLQSRKNVSVLVTGGFHAEGLAEKFKQRGLAYVDILPRISDLKNNNQYLNVMTLGAAPASANNHPSYADLPALNQSLPAVGAFYTREAAAAAEEVKREHPEALLSKRAESRFSEKVSMLEDKNLRRALTPIAGLLDVEGFSKEKIEKPLTKGNLQHLEMLNFRNAGKVIKRGILMRKSSSSIAREAEPYFEAVIAVYRSAAMIDLAALNSRTYALEHLDAIVRLLADHYKVTIEKPSVQADPMEAFTAQFSDDVHLVDPSQPVKAKKMTWPELFASRRSKKILGTAYTLVFNWVSFIGLSAFAWYLFYRYQENEIFGMKVEAENENQKLVLSLFRFLMVAGGAAFSLLPAALFRWMRAHSETSFRAPTPTKPITPLSPKQLGDLERRHEAEDRKKNRAEMRFGDEVSLENASIGSSDPKFRAIFDLMKQNQDIPEDAQRLGERKVKTTGDLTIATLNFQDDDGKDKKHFIGPRLPPFYKTELYTHGSVTPIVRKTGDGQYSLMVEAQSTITNRRYIVASYVLVQNGKLRINDFDSVRTAAEFPNLRGEAPFVRSPYLREIMMGLFANEIPEPFRKIPIQNLREWGFMGGTNEKSVNFWSSLGGGDAFRWFFSDKIPRENLELHFDLIPGRPGAWTASLWVGEERDSATNTLLRPALPVQSFEIYSPENGFAFNTETEAKAGYETVQGSVPNVKSTKRDLVKALWNVYYLAHGGPAPSDDVIANPKLTGRSGYGDDWVYNWNGKGLSIDMGDFGKGGLVRAYVSFKDESGKIIRGVKYTSNKTGQVKYYSLFYDNAFHAPQEITNPLEVTGRETNEQAAAPGNPVSLEETFSPLLSIEQKLLILKERRKLFARMAELEERRESVLKFTGDRNRVRSLRRLQTAYKELAEQAEALEKVRITGDFTGQDALKNRLQYKTAVGLYETEILRGAEALQLLNDQVRDIENLGISDPQFVDPQFLEAAFVKIEETFGGKAVEVDVQKIERSEGGDTFRVFPAREGVSIEVGTGKVAPWINLPNYPSSKVYMTLEREEKGPANARKSYLRIRLYDPAHLHEPFESVYFDYETQRFVSSSDEWFNYFSGAKQLGVPGDLLAAHLDTFDGQLNLFKGFDVDGVRTYGFTTFGANLYEEQNHQGFLPFSSQGPGRRYYAQAEEKNGKKFVHIYGSAALTEENHAATFEWIAGQENWRERSHRASGFSEPLEGPVREYSSFNPEARGQKDLQAALSFENAPSQPREFLAAATVGAGNQVELPLPEGIESEEQAAVKLSARYGNKGSRVFWRPVTETRERALDLYDANGHFIERVFYPHEAPEGLTSLMEVSRRFKELENAIRAGLNSLPPPMLMQESETAHAGKWTLLDTSRGRIGKKEGTNVIANIFQDIKSIKFPEGFSWDSIWFEYGIVEEQGVKLPAIYAVAVNRTKREERLAMRVVEVSPGQYRYDTYPGGREVTGTVFPVLNARGYTRSISSPAYPAQLERRISEIEEEIRREEIPRQGIEAAVAFANQGLLKNLLDAKRDRSENRSWAEIHFYLSSPEFLEGLAASAAPIQSLHETLQENPEAFLKHETVARFLEQYAGDSRLHSFFGPEAWRLNGIVSLKNLTDSFRSGQPLPQNVQAKGLMDLIALLSLDLVSITDTAVRLTPGLTKYQRLHIEREAPAQGPQAAPAPGPAAQGEQEGAKPWISLSDINVGRGVFDLVQAPERQIPTFGDLIPTMRVPAVPAPAPAVPSAETPVEETVPETPAVEPQQEPMVTGSQAGDMVAEEWPQELSSLDRKLFITVPNPINNYSRRKEVLSELEREYTALKTKIAAKKKQAQALPEVNPASAWAEYRAAIHRKNRPRSVLIRRGESYTWEASKSLPAAERAFHEKLHEVVGKIQRENPGTEYFWIEMAPALNAKSEEKPAFYVTGIDFKNKTVSPVHRVLELSKDKYTTSVSASAFSGEIAAAVFDAVSQHGYRFFEEPSAAEALIEKRLQQVRALNQLENLPWDEIAGLQVLIQEFPEKGIQAEGGQTLAPVMTDLVSVLQFSRQAAGALSPLDGAQTKNFTTGPALLEVFFFPQSQSLKRFFAWTKKIAEAEGNPDAQTAGEFFQTEKQARQDLYLFLGYQKFLIDPLDSLLNKIESGDSNDSHLVLLKETAVYLNQTRLHRFPEAVLPAESELQAPVAVTPSEPAPDAPAAPVIEEVPAPQAVETQPAPAETAPSSPETPAAPAAPAAEETETPAASEPQPPAHAETLATLIRIIHEQGQELKKNLAETEDPDYRRELEEIRQAWIQYAANLSAFIHELTPGQQRDYLHLLSQMGHLFPVTVRQIPVFMENNQILELLQKLWDDQLPELTALRAQRNQAEILKKIGPWDDFVSDFLRDPENLSPAFLFDVFMMALQVADFSELPVSDAIDLLNDTEALLAELGEEDTERRAQFEAKKMELKNREEAEKRRLEDEKRSKISDLNTQMHAASTLQQLEHLLKEIEKINPLDSTVGLWRFHIGIRRDLEDLRDRARNESFFDTAQYDRAFAGIEQDIRKFGSQRLYGYAKANQRTLQALFQQVQTDYYGRMIESGITQLRDDIQRKKIKYREQAGQRYDNLLQQMRIAKGKNLFPEETERTVGGVFVQVEGFMRTLPRRSEMRWATAQVMQNAVSEAFTQTAEAFFSARGFQAEVLTGFPDGITVNLYPSDPALRERLSDRDLGADLDRIEVPFGSVAQLKVSIIDVNAEPALFIEELHPSAGYRNLLGLERDIWAPYQSWTDDSVAFVLEISKTLGDMPFYAKSPNLARLQNPEMGHGSADRYYNKPFPANTFRKTRVFYKNHFHTWQEVQRERERDLRERGRDRQFLGGEALLWHYEPHVWVNNTERVQMHPLPQKQFKAVQRLLDGRIVKTPLQELSLVGEAVHQRVFLKDESRQKTGSFKYRGVYAEILAAIEKVLAEEPDGGLAKLQRGLKIVTQSTGNHGIALIRATGDIIEMLKQSERYRDKPEFLKALNKIEPVVFTLNPKKLPRVKLQKMAESLRHYRSVTGNRNGLIVNKFNSYARALQARERFIQESPETRFYMEHGGKEIILGHGTAGLEIVEQLREAGIDENQKVVVIVPVGAGGPLGIGAAAKEARKNTQFVMVQSDRWDAFVRTLKSGKIEQNLSGDATTDTIRRGRKTRPIIFADGIAVDKPEAVAVFLAAEYADAALAVDERAAYDKAGPLLMKETNAAVGGTTALTLQALLDYGLDVEAIRDADAVVLFGTEGNVDPLVTEHLSNRVKKAPEILDPYTKRFASVRQERERHLRAENRDPLTDEAEAMLVYLKEDSGTRMNTNLAARNLQTAVNQGLEDYIETVNRLKTKARADKTPVGTVNQILFETTRGDEGLRRKVSEYYEILFAEWQRSEEMSVPRKEALNAILSLGIGHLMTVSPELDEAKAGGMADVLTELYPALAAVGVSVTRVTPGYRGEKTGKPGENGRNHSIYRLIRNGKATHSGHEPIQVHIGPLKISGTNHYIPGSERNLSAEIYEHREGDLHTVHLYNPDISPVLYPPGLNGEASLKLSLFLSRGALEYIRRAGLFPGFVITNDWMTNFIPLYLRVDPWDTSYKNDPHLKNMLSIVMGHNMGKPYQMRVFTNEGYRGLPYDNFNLINVSGEHYAGISDPEDPSRMNFVRAALTHSDAVLMVSPGYLEENLQPGSASGLDWLLREKAQTSGGISNGLDRKWLRDFDTLGRQHLGLAPYAGLEKNRLGEYLENLSRFKAKMKQDVQRVYSEQSSWRQGKNIFGSLKEDPDKILITMAARLAEQKGVELMTQGIKQVLDQSSNVQILIAGSVPDTGQGTIEQYFRTAMETLSQDERYQGRFVFHPEFIDPKLVLLAGDAFMMPSKDEPGGIAQLQALLAGAAVIGRSVGGIANTVRPFKPRTLEGDGFLFSEFTTEAFVKKMLLAVRTLKIPRARAAIVRNAATSNNFWDTRVPYYLAFLQKMAGVLDYDYPHLAKARELLKEVQPHLQPQAQPAQRPEHRIAKVKAGKKVDGTFSPAQQMRSEEDWGIADFKTMKKSVILAQKLRQKIIQLLPMSRPKAFDSPYAAVSARLLDSANISIPAVKDELAAMEIPSSEIPGLDDFLEQKKEEILVLNRGSRVNRPAIDQLKREALQFVWKWFQEKRPKAFSEQYQQFLTENISWLEDDVLYLQLLNKFSAENPSAGWDWRNWEEKIRDRDSETIAQLKREMTSQMEFEYFVQFIANRQFDDLVAYGEQRSVDFMEDTPLAPGEADTWIHPHLFGLKKENGYLRLISQGVPPDPFSFFGQYWQFFAYDFTHAGTEKYLLDLFRFKQKRFSYIRLDHVLGYYRQYLFTEDPSHSFTLEKLGLFSEIEAVRQRALQGAITKREAGIQTLGLIKQRLLQLRQFRRTDRLPDDIASERRPFFEAALKTLPEDTLELLFNENDELVEDSMLAIFRETPEAERGQALPADSTWKREYRVEPKRQEDYTPLEVGKKEGYERYLENYLFPADGRGISPDDKLTLGYFKLAPGESILSKYIRLAQEKGAVMIWEVLGIVPDVIQASVNRLAGAYAYFPIIWGLNKKDNYHPNQMVANAYTTFDLHDSTGLRGRWEKELTRDQRKEVLDGLFGEGHYTSEDLETLTENVQFKLLEMVYAPWRFMAVPEGRENVSMAVLTWSALLGLPDEDYRLNIPGQIGQWVNRLPLEVTLEKLILAAENHSSTPEAERTIRLIRRLQDSRNDAASGEAGKPLFLRADPDTGRKVFQMTEFSEIPAPEEHFLLDIYTAADAKKVTVHLKNDEGIVTEIELSIKAQDAEEGLLKWTALWTPNAEDLKGKNFRHYSFTVEVTGKDKKEISQTGDLLAIRKGANLKPGSPQYVLKEFLQTFFARSEMRPSGMLSLQQYVETHGLEFEDVAAVSDISQQTLPVMLTQAAVKEALAAVAKERNTGKEQGVQKIEAMRKIFTDSLRNSGYAWLADAMEKGRMPERLVLPVEADTSMQSLAELALLSGVQKVDILVSGISERDGFGLQKEANAALELWGGIRPEFQLRVHAAPEAQDIRRLSQKLLAQDVTSNRGMASGRKEDLEGVLAMRGVQPMHSEKLKKQYDLILMVAAAFMRDKAQAQTLGKILNLDSWLEERQFDAAAFGAAMLNALKAIESAA